MGKTERFTGLNVDLERLATRLQMYLQENGFEVAYSKDSTAPPSWFFIQARKVSTLRSIAGARRSTDITIKGKPDDFEVAISTGEWGKNMLSSAPLFIVPIVGITATVAKLYTAKSFESNLWKYIRDQTRFLSNSAVQVESRERLDKRSYDCDYIEGYPGWKDRVEGGKLVLERSRDGSNRIVFTSGKGEIVIPAGSIEQAQIIARRKGLHEHDLMIQMVVKQDGGKSIKPVFNLRDDIIAGVLAGINELVSEERALRSIEHASIVTDVRYCVKCGAEIARSARFCPQCGAPQES
ncbi:MAG: zinc ribbon domain-containing protein [Candidatus Nitrosocaldus sp.]|nr:zinc ribbon domain-containing protein [Candidatus Nitrosocaldus sp.]MDW8274757.1 zinc ribbon domain-containing protein [Candidatus Nitrosocaldus sp.]